jgi:hypothetical protein
MRSVGLSQGINVEETVKAAQVEEGGKRNDAVEFGGETRARR